MVTTWTPCRGNGGPFLGALGRTENGFSVQRLRGRLQLVVGSFPVASAGQFARIVNAEQA